MKNLLMISVLGISACADIYAADREEQPHNTVTSSTLPHPQQDIDYNPFMMDLYKDQKWDEIIGNAAQVETILNDSQEKVIPLTYDTINIIGQAYWHTQKYKEGMFYFDKLTGLLAKFDEKSPAVMNMANKAIGLNANDQTTVPPAVLAIAHAWMATHLWETMYSDMLKDPGIASELKAKHNWQVIDNFKLAFFFFPPIDSFFNSTAAYFYLTNGMYKEADAQFTEAINKLKKLGQEPSEDLARDAAEAHEKAQNTIQLNTPQTTENDQVDSPKEAINYNTFIQDLHNSQKWNEIIQASANLASDFRREIPTLSATIPINQQSTIFSNLSRETLASIGEAYLQTDIREGIEFFTYCKGLYPAMVNFSPDVLEEISGWLNTYLSKTKDNAVSVNQKEDIALSEIIAGNSFMQQGNYQAAVLQYDTAIQKMNEAQKPTTSILLEMAGLANYQAQNWAKALTYYKQAKEASPSKKFESVQNYMYLGQCYYTVGEKQKSLEEFKQGFAENPDETALAYIAAAQPAMDLNEWEIAADWLKKAITKDSNQKANIYADAGLSFLMTKDNAQALEYLNKALELDPSLPQRVYDRRDMAKIRLEQIN